MEAIGRNHSFETALADLVDNSIDAGATHVLIRFVRAAGQLTSLYVVDNGRGIPPGRINEAMTIGGRRAYMATDLGRFGVGLKAASFSQARELTVLSQAAGFGAVGRRWRLDESQTGFHCDLVPEEFAANEIHVDRGIPRTGTGTVIRWDHVGGFPTRDPGSVELFVTGKINAASEHLGLVFHRLIEDGTVVINLDVHEAGSQTPTSPITVGALNPFKYHRTGATGFPKSLTATAGGVGLTFRCHIWPPRSVSPEFKLDGRPVDRQGLYFYRRGRLLQAGGWEGVHAKHPRLQLARVEVEIDDDVESLFQMNPEKSRVQVRPEFSRASAEAAAEDGTTFSDYFFQAEQVYQVGNKRDKTRKPMIPPGDGFPPGLRKIIEQEIPAAKSDPIDIRWRKFEGDAFFDIDRDGQTIWLNKDYRKKLLGDRHGGLNDLPLIKTLIYLLMEDVFNGDYLGSRDKDNIELWRSLLTTAVRAERR